MQCIPTNEYAGSANLTWRSVSLCFELMLTVRLKPLLLVLKSCIKHVISELKAACLGTSCMKSSTNHLVNNLTVRYEEKQREKILWHLPGENSSCLPRRVQGQERQPTFHWSIAKTTTLLDSTLLTFGSQMFEGLCLRAKYY